MTTELLKEPDGVVADFHVKFQSDDEPATTGDKGRSLIDEVIKCRSEVSILRDNVQQLCQAVRGLVTLLSVLDRKIDTALKGGFGADCGVL